MSIIALSAHGAGSSSVQGALIPGCLAIGCAVFGGYALVFSTAAARRWYARARRAMEGCLAVVFGMAGLKLLTARQ